jgi:phosphoribosylanthranilate isomerase
VKICGVTNPEDAILAARCGADAVGVVYIKESPRYVSLREAEKIFSALPVFVSRAVVAAPQSLDDVLEIEKTGADCIQLHGCEPPEFAEEIAENTRLRVIKAFAAEPGCEKLIQAYLGIVDAILLDTKFSGIVGGTGKTHDWNISRRVVESVSAPVILAGGLTPENVKEAVKQAKPYAVDVSSGVETSPGKKDGKKVKAFVSEATK